MTSLPDGTRPPGLVLVIDAVDAAAVADFWSSALRYEQQGSVAHFRILVPPGDDGPTLLIQQVAEVTPGSNRVHLDLHVEDREAEARRLTDRGARRLRNGSLDGELHWITMSDPEGNVFDVVEDPPS